MQSPPRSRPSVRPTGPTAALLSLILAACGSEDTAQPPADDAPPAAGASAVLDATGEVGPPAPGPQGDVRIPQIVRILTKPAPELGSQATNAWLDDLRALMESLGPGDADLGLAMIAEFEARPDHGLGVRRGLVEAIARTASPEAAVFVEGLVHEYGMELGVRTTAAEKLYLASPERALEALGPLLRERPRATYPPAERILDGWLEAVRIVGQDPSEVLALLATDLYREDAARHRAVKALGDCRTPAARRALETVLVESTGNAYLRRLAAQQISRSFERDAACEMLEQVLSREADVNMQVFLANLITSLCP